MHTVHMDRTCPACRQSFDACSNLTGQSGPGPGDFTICIRCAAVMRFRKDMTVEHVQMSSVPSNLWPQFDTIRFDILFRNAPRQEAAR